jgi:hypothetical protein
MFERAYGSFAMGEAQYSIDQHEVVVMHSNGNVTDYVHSACAWLHEGYYSAEDGTAMAWTIEKTFPNTVIMRFNAAPANLPVPFNGYRGFVPCLNDSKYYGPMQLQGAFNSNPQASSSAHFVNEKISKMTFASWGPSILALESGVSELVIVPKSLVYEAARFMVGKPRNESSFSTLCSQVRHFMTGYDLPPDMVPRAAFLAATLGFVCNLDFEMSLMANMGKHVNSFASMDHLLKFRFPWVLPEFTFPAISTLLIAAAFRMKLPRTAKLGLMGVGAFVGIAPYLPLILKLASKALRRFDDERPGSRYSEPSNGFRGGAASIHTSISWALSLLLRGAKSFYSLLQRTRSVDYNYLLRSVRDEIVGFVTPGDKLVPLSGPVSFPTVECNAPLLPLTTWRRDDHGLVDQAKMPRVSYRGERFYNVIPDTVKAVGLIVSEVIPVVHASSANNELHSLHNRVANVPISPDLDFFQVYKEYTLMNFDVIFPGHYHYPLVYNFDAWNRRFPPAKRLAHTKAYEADSSMPFDTRASTRIKAFVKLEKRLDANMLTYEEGRPRFIMGGEDSFNVIVGPWCYSLGNKLSKVWSADFGVYFTGGSNAENIGEWFSQLGHNNPEYHDADADFKSFDSTQYMELCRFEIELDVRLGLPQDVGNFMISAISHKGATAHKVVFFVYDGRGSGRPNTMSGNSIVNGTTKIFAVQCANPHLTIHQVLSSVKLAVVGDDGLDRVQRHMMCDYDVFLKRLGLNSVITPRRDSRFLEYCSCRFWPTADGFVLGRKVGLAIPKCGYYINQSHRRIMGIHKSALIGEVLNSHFIPPYRAIVEQQLSLLSNVKARSLAELPDRGLNIATIRKHDSCRDTWEMLEAVYDWTVSDQCRLEIALSSLTTLPSILPGHLVEKFLLRDSDLKSWRGVAASIWHSNFLQPVQDCYSKLLTFFRGCADDTVVNAIDSLNDKARVFPALSNSKSPYADMVLVCYLSPVSEECFKRVKWRGYRVGLVMPLLELCLSMLKNYHLKGLEFQQLLATRLVTAFMHYLWYLMPLKWGIASHMLWNMMSLNNPNALASILN